MSTDHDPIARFQDAFARAKAAGTFDATAMTLATVSKEGRPSARVVLLKAVDARGFVFYTNRESRKGRELGETQVAALCFYWPQIDEQVRVEGAVSWVSDEESDAYFASRPRVSQIGAWASHQSEQLGSREELEARVRELEARYPGQVPRPPHWGGYRVTPERIEFWHAGTGRLHDRALHTLVDGAWTVTRLNP